jgi:hypothetical protein
MVKIPQFPNVTIPATSCQQISHRLMNWFRRRDQVSIPELFYEHIPMQVCIAIDPHTSYCFPFFAHMKHTPDKADPDSRTTHQSHASHEQRLPDLPAFEKGESLSSLREK